MGVASRHTGDLTGAAFVAAVFTAPSLALLLGAGDEGDLTGLVHVSGFVSYALVLGAGVLTYFHRRLVSVTRSGSMEERLAQWLTVGLTAGAVNGLLQVALGDPGAAGWLMAGQLAVLLALCVCAAVAERIDVPGEPALVCTGVAVAIPMGYLLVQLWAPPTSMGTAQAALLNTGIMVTSLLLAWIVLNRTHVSLWARRRLAVAIVLMSGAECLQNVGWHSTLMASAVVAHLMGAAVLCALAHQLLRRTLQESQSEIEVLQRSLADVRSVIARDRELLHEVGATLAGITSASRVMHLGHGVTVHRRQRLETMLAAELARLERLMQQRVGGSTDDQDRRLWIDDVVEPVVTSHQARGRDVTWQPTGHEAVGDPDELAELCNILLENAARHAGGAPVTLSVVACDGGVEVVCSDRGPGVAPALRDRIFDAEVKGDRSPGQGLGLAIAKRLATDRGGDLRLVDHGRPGATFLASLPAKEMADGSASHVA